MILSPGCVKASVQKLRAGTIPGVKVIHSLSDTPVMTVFKPVDY